MPQHDYSIASQPGGAFRADINNALLSIATNNSGTSAPSTTFGSQWWFDSTNYLLRMRSSDNLAWRSLLFNDNSILALRPAKNAIATPAYSFEDDPDTGVTSTAPNQLDFIVGSANEMQLSDNLLSLQNITGGIILPSGTTAQRRGSPQVGEERYNTTTKLKELFREQWGWTPIAVRANNNELLNGNFSIWERGTTFNAVANGAWTANQWRVLYNGSGLTRNITSIDENGWNGTTGVVSTGQSAPTLNPESGLRWSQSGTPSGVTFNILRHCTDGATLFHGHNYVTLSFYARTSTGSALQNIYAVQKFNSAGGGSADVTIAISNGVVNLTSSWQRYAFTFAVPSCDGKTFAANNQFVIDFDFPRTAGSHTIDLSRVKLEGGGAATLGWNWRENHWSIEYAECRRHFYREWRSIYVEGNAGSANFNAVSEQILALPMRVTPTVVSGPTFSGSSNTSLTIVDNLSNQGFRVRAISAAAGSFGTTLVAGSLHLSAELPLL